MRAGRLDRRIRIERATVDRDTHGGKTETWALLMEVYAQVTPLRGRELVAAGQVMPGVETKFTIRWREGILPADRIVYEGVHYDIQHLAEIGRRVALEILAKRP